MEWGLQNRSMGEDMVKIWNLEFPGASKNSMWNFQGLIENEVEFPRVTKKK